VGAAPVRQPVQQHLDRRLAVHLLELLPHLTDVVRRRGDVTGCGTEPVRCLAERLDGLIDELLTRVAEEPLHLSVCELDLADLVATVGALKQTRRDILASVDDLKAVQPLFRSVVEGVAIMADSLDDMVDVLEQVQSDVELMGEGSLTREDAEDIGKAWAVVGEDCTTWLDVVNAQGIDPSL